jgi:hypothetical protein
MTSIIGIVQIENNTAGVLGLNPTHNFPVGVKLVPGLNTVPKTYMAELDALEVATEIGGKPGPSRFPGRERIAQLQDPQVRYYDPETARAKRGAQITIYTAEQAGRAEGPPAPEDLRAMSLEAAHNDKEDLKRWRKADGRKDVKAWIDAKLSD